MSAAIASAFVIRSPLPALLRRDDLGKLFRFGAGAFGLVVASGLFVAAATSTATACTGTTLMASAVQLPALSHPV